MDPTDVLRNGRVSVSSETYAVCRTDEPHPSAFATVRDGPETTVVVETDAVDSHATRDGLREQVVERLRN